MSTRRTTGTQCRRRNIVKRRRKKISTEIKSTESYFLQTTVNGLTTSPM